MIKKKKMIITNQGGFTLIEVMVAVSIFAIGIIAAIGIQYSVVGGNANGNIVSQEMMLAQRLMEEAKNVPDPINFSSYNLNGVDQFGDAPGPFNVNVVSSVIPSNSSGRVVTVTISKIGGIDGHPVVVKSVTTGDGV